MSSTAPPGDATAKSEAKSEVRSSASGSGDTAPAGREAAAEARGTLSQLLAQILDQLSVTAWLPAGVLVGSLLLLGSLNSHDNHLGRALQSIGDLELKTIVLLVGVVVMATVVTQAFEFEAIRALEGYWGGGVLAGALAAPLCRVQLHRRRRIEARLERLDDKLFPQIRHVMLKRGVRRSVVDIIEAQLLSDQPVKGRARDLADAEAINWLNHLPPHQRRRHDALSDALDEDFPPEPLLLPTKLGNILRGAEHPLMGDDSAPLEGRLLPVYDRLPAAIRYEHDQYRGRLDLYCSLVFVFITIGISSVPILTTAGKGSTTGPVAVAVVAAALGALLSYRAAVVSARKYGAVIRTIIAGCKLA